LFNPLRTASIGLTVDACFPKTWRHPDSAQQEGRTMPEFIAKPSRIAAAGNKPKTADFDEYTLVLMGALRVEYRGGALDVHTGRAVLVRRGEWVRYSTPGEEGAEYVAVCLPAFSLDGAHRDAGATRS
jgi:mannose-6-phosphate isomerase-like protein (cupin superfamily)